MLDNYGGPERRHGQRFPFANSSPYLIRFRDSGTDNFQTSTSGNIGFGGILLISDFSFSIGDFIDIEISFEDGNTAITIVIQSTVIWIETRNEDENNEINYHVGAEFNIATEEESETLNKFIEKHIL